MHDFIYKGLGEAADEQGKALMEHLSALLMCKSHIGEVWGCNETNHIS